MAISCQPKFSAWQLHRRYQITRRLKQHTPDKLSGDFLVCELSKQAVECGECGAAVPADARFCPKCDALVQAQVGFDWDAMTKEAKTAFGKED